MRIRGISQIRKDNGVLEITLTKTSGRSLVLPCSSANLLDLAKGMRSEELVRILRRRELEVLVKDRCIVHIEGLPSVQKVRKEGAPKSRRSLWGKKARQTSVEQRSTPRRRQGVRQTRKYKATVQAARSEKARVSRARDRKAEESGVRMCRHCGPVRTLCTWEAGKRVYRCRNCGSICGYS